MTAAGSANHVPNERMSGSSPGCMSTQWVTAVITGQECTALTSPQEPCEGVWLQNPPVHSWLILWVTVWTQALPCTLYISQASMAGISALRTRPGLVLRSAINSGATAKLIALQSSGGHDSGLHRLHEYYNIKPGKDTVLWVWVVFLKQFSWSRANSHPTITSWDIPLNPEQLDFMVFLTLFVQVAGWVLAVATGCCLQPNACRHTTWIVAKRHLVKLCRRTCGTAGQKDSTDPVWSGGEFSHCWMLSLVIGDD